MEATAKRTGLRTLFLAATVVMLAADPSAARKAKLKLLPCTGSRFLLPAEAPLITGAAAVALDAVVLDEAGRISIASGCPAVRAKLKPGRKRTLVRARWKKGACAGLRGKARLVGKLDATCTTLTGTLRAKKYRKRFTARLSTCGDGVLDRDGGERCATLEGPLDGLAVDAIADLDLETGVPDGEITDFPNGSRLARTRLEIELADGATVGDVNALLAEVGGEIILALEHLPFLTVRIPDPGTPEALNAVVATLEAHAAVVSVDKGWFPEPTVIPSNYIPTLDSLRPIRHLIGVRADLAWNARRAVRPAAERPTLIVPDFFGDGVPNADFGLTGLVPADFTTGALDTHGYHVLGIATATFGAAVPCRNVMDGRPCVTGMMPEAIAARALDMTNPAIAAEMNTRLVRLVRDTPGNVIVNTSLSQCGTGMCGNVTVAREYGRRWIRRLDTLGIRDRFLHVTASGNVPGKPSGTDATTISRWAAAALLRIFGFAPLDGVLAVDNVALFAGGFTPACLSVTSFPGGHLAAVGKDVFSFAGASAGTAFKTGTSMATPAVAGLAAYLWSIDPGMSIADLRSTLLATAKKISSPPVDPACSTAAAAPVIDAYDAVLALDQASLPTPTSAPVRNAILDVAGNDGRFDAADLAQYLGKYLQGFVSGTNHGPPVAPTQADFSRWDLNGDGLTGGPGRYRFDLDRVGSTRYGAARLSTVQQDVEGTAVSFDETKLTDLEVLCYYAYSSLFQGTAAERAALVDPVLCGVPSTTFDYTTIGGGFFHYCVDKAHTTIEAPDGTITNGVRDDFCRSDQVPNFGTFPVPPPGDLAGSACMVGRVAGSFATFDPNASVMTGKRTERNANFDEVFYSEWTADVDTAQPRITELTIEKCVSSGAFKEEDYSYVLPNLPGEAFLGFARFRLTGQAVCDAFENGSFSVQTFLGSIALTETTTVTSFECGTDPTTNYLEVFLNGS
jgi:Subtilase family